MQKQLNQINPWYISGLVQADGSFFCVLSKKANALYGLQFRPKFVITIDLDSVSVLINIKNYFKCGTILTNRNVAEFIVDNKKDIKNIIIPHFLQYPVVLDKLHSFNLFKNIVTILLDNTHRTKQKRRLVLQIALSINSVSQRTNKNISLLYKLIGLKNSIPTIPNVNNTILTEINNRFIVGFIDGDGSFSISFNKDGTQTRRVSLVGSRSIKPLLDLIKSKFFNIGSFRLEKENTIIRWVVVGLNQIRNIIIPFIDNELLHTEKSRHYQIFRIVCFILDKPNLSLSDRLQIVEIAYNINKNGKRRKISKGEYIKLLNKNIPHVCKII